MKKYETVIIINDTLTQEKKNEIVNKILDYITKNGNVISKDNYGSKKLAYEIRNQKTGYYYIINFEAESTAIYELERIYRITDGILKFIVVRVD